MDVDLVDLHLDPFDQGSEDRTLACHRQLGPALAAARGRCKTLVRVAPVGSTVPVGAVTVAENQTNGFNIGVRFEGSIPPSVKPRISENLFVGTAPANFVQGPPGFTFDGSNGPQP